VWCRRLAVLLDVTALSPGSPENLEEGALTGTKPRTRRFAGSSGGDRVVEKVGAYREYAGECRRLAKQMKDPGNVDQLRQIAKAWDDLAADRERRLRERGVIPNRPGADAKPRYSSH
jgi:hypothetical protein